MMSSDQTRMLLLVLTSHFGTHDGSLVDLYTLFRYSRVSHKLRDFVNRTPQLFRNVVLSYGIRYDHYETVHERSRSRKGAVQWLLRMCPAQTETLVVRNLPCSNKIARKLKSRLPNLTQLSLFETKTSTIGVCWIYQKSQLHT
jgi:hypothetical protein